MNVLIGIDDTDDETSRGTGHHARRLGTTLDELGLAKLQAITRHQLLIDPRIEYTSRNSSACLVLNAAGGSIPQLLDYLRADLLDHAAGAADAGVCIAPTELIDDSMLALGLAAKSTVLAIGEVLEAAERSGVALERLSGTGSGVVGALAAVGLHASGDDGRYIWLPGLRELSGRHTVAELASALRVRVATAEGTSPPAGALLEVADWVRPVRRGGEPVLLVQQERVDGRSEWSLAGKPTVRSLSD